MVGSARAVPKFCEGSRPGTVDRLQHAGRMACVYARGIR